MPIGADQQSYRYDDPPTGCGSEFFCGNRHSTRRMIKARYPNAGSYARLDAIADVGEAGEFPPQNFHPERNSLRNPRSGCYIVDHHTAERIGIQS